MWKYIGLSFLLMAPVYPQSDSEGGSEVEKMRNQLRHVLEQNKRLERQNRQLNVIMNGLQQMCSALNLKATECIPTTNIDVKPQTQNRLVLHTVSSSGAEEGSVTVTVYYSAPENHSVAWMGLSLKYHEMKETSGMAGIDENTGRRYTKLKVRNLNDTAMLLLRLITDSELLSVNFNLAAIETAEDQQIKSGENPIKLNSSYTVPIGEDLLLNMTFDGDLRDSNILRDMDTVFNGLNSSADPNSIFNLVYQGIKLTASPISNGTQFNVSVRLLSQYAQYGGVLELSLPLIRQHGFLQEYKIGKYIEVVPQEVQEVVQSNSIGVLPMKNITYVFKDSSLSCFALGNPDPTISVVRKRANSEDLVHHETLLKQKYTVMVAVPITAKESDISGKYICRATNGNKTAETETVVRIAKSPSFDHVKTGVMKNTTRKTVVSCKATGVPRPKLEMLLYDEFGPDLSKSGLFKVHRRKQGSSTSRLMMTLSPKNDLDIHTVYCVASQPELPSSPFVQQKIQVFQERERNWDLLNRVSELVYNTTEMT